MARDFIGGVYRRDYTGVGSVWAMLGIFKLMSMLLSVKENLSVGNASQYRGLFDDGRLSFQVLA